MDYPLTLELAALLVADSAVVLHPGIKVERRRQPVGLALVAGAVRQDKVMAQVHRVSRPRHEVIDVSGLSVDRPSAKGEAAKLTKNALLRNLDIAEKLGCLSETGLAEMRRGNAPTVMRGPYAGDELSVDHIIPRAVVPELDNVIANLELMPLRMNKSKNTHIGDRQRALAKKLFQAGLLSRKGLDMVLPKK